MSFLNASKQLIFFTPRSKGSGKDYPAGSTATLIGLAVVITAITAITATFAEID